MAAFGWRSVFFVNVPVGIFTIVVTALVLQQQARLAGEEEQSRPRFDWLGAGLSGLALLGFLMVVGNGHRLGWSSPAVLLVSVATVATVAAFIWWELRTAAPMLDLRLFKRKLVAIGIGASWLSFLGSQSVRFMMPFYMQRVLELNPRDIGLLLIPSALCMVLLGPLSGRLSDRFGWRVLTVSGLCCSAAAAFVFAATLTESSSVLVIVLLLMLQSTGMALFNSPNNSSILGAVDRTQYGVVSGLTQLVRNSANVTSIAIATVVVVVTMGTYGVEPSLDAVSPQVADAFVAGLQWAFLVMGGMLVVGIALAVVRGERRPEPAAMARQESAEVPAD